MNDSQTSCAYEVKSGHDDVAIEAALEKVKDYLTDRIDEIENRLANGSRSIFDFVDMAVLIGALANLIDASANSQCGHDTNQFIDFVKSELVQPTETQSDMVATVFYCLMRCGLVHEMSLGGHNVRPTRQSAIDGYSIGVTHDKSYNDNWYAIDANRKEVVFYARELLEIIKSCVDRCFDGQSEMYNVVCQKVTSDAGIKIIGAEGKRG